MLPFTTSLLALTCAVAASASSVRWPQHEPWLQWIAGVSLVAGLALVGWGLGEAGLILTRW